MEAKPQNRPKTGKLVYMQSNGILPLAIDKPFAVLQAIKKQCIIDGLIASKLKITY